MFVVLYDRTTRKIVNTRQYTRKKLIEFDTKLMSNFVSFLFRPIKHAYWILFELHYPWKKLPVIYASLWTYVMYVTYSLDESLFKVYPFRIAMAIRSLISLLNENQKWQIFHEILKKSLQTDFIFGIPPNKTLKLRLTRSKSWSDTYFHY